MISFRHFSFTYWRQEHPALKDVNLSIARGEMVLLTGPSGGGKTSICRCLNGLIPHFYGGTLSGRVEIGGLDITEHQPREFATRVGMVFQDPENQLIGADVERDIAFGLENLGLPSREIDRRVEESLQALGITGLRRKPHRSLSGGEKQKAVLAAALAMQPQVMVLDEPTSELDPLSAREFMQMLAELQRRYGMTVVLAEHRLERVVQYCDRMVVVDEGRVTEDGDTRPVLDRLAADPRGVGIPPMAELAAALRSAGVWQGPTPLSVEEAQMQLGPLLPVMLPQTTPERPRSTAAPLAKVDRVSFRYRRESPLLHGISASFCPGEFVALLGRNGSGKTTLIKHLNGLLKPVQGAVFVKGLDTHSVAVSRLARSVGIVFQNPNDHLFAETVEEEVRFTLTHLGIHGEQAESSLEDAMRQFGLCQYRTSYPRSLSGGERQRVALASIVAARPDILVLDEPTRGLDRGAKVALMEFLREYCCAGRVVVLVTHDVEMVIRHVDRALLLDQGRLLAGGPVREVLAGSEAFRPDIHRLALPYYIAADAARFMTVEDVMEALI